MLQSLYLSRMNSQLLGCLEVVEYSLKERFNMKYLHQVPYLRLQDVIGVCLSYCCLSGTTPGIISAFARCNWCVPILLLPIRYNVCTCRSPIYCCLSGTTCIPVTVQDITTSLLHFYLVYCIIAVCVVVMWSSSLYLPRMNSQRGRWVCWKSKNTCLKRGLIRNTYARYICLMRVLTILLSIRYNVCTCHSPTYPYITATPVYLIQYFITACVVVMLSHCLYLSRMNSQCVHYVCCKSTSTRWKSGLRWNTHGVDKHHFCLVFSVACICELP